MALADAGIKIEDYLWYQKATQKGKEEGEEGKSLSIAVNLLKADKLSLEDIATAIDKDINFVLNVKERIAKGEL